MLQFFTSLCTALFLLSVPIVARKIAQLGGYGHRNDAQALLLFQVVMTFLITAAIFSGYSVDSATDILTASVFGLYTNGLLHFSATAGIAILGIVRK